MHDAVGEVGVLFSDPKAYGSQRGHGQGVDVRDYLIGYDARDSVGFKDSFVDIGIGIVVVCVV